MEGALLALRIALAGMFALSGVAKLADRPGSRQALRDFGVPERLTAPLGILLPIAELLVAAFLLLPATTWWGALGALSLLLLFMLGISLNLARGRTPDCHCFGQLHSAPIGWRTLVRNAALAGVAGFVLWGSRAGTERALTPIEWAVLAAVCAAALLAGIAWLLLALWRQQGRLLLRLEALEAAAPARPIHVQPLPVKPSVGASAPEFALASVDTPHQKMSLRDLLARGKPVLLLFTDPHCGPCNALLPQLSRWQREHVDKLSVVLVSRGSEADNRAKALEHGLTNLLLQQDFEVAKAYNVGGTPSAVLVRPDGTVGSSVAGGAEAITDLVAKTIRKPLEGSRRNQTQFEKASPTVQIGQLAPTISLRDMEGAEVNLRDFRGHPTLLLFWNPGCGFCQRMVDDLKFWKARELEGIPRLVLISSGSAEAVRAQHLEFPTLLDETFLAGRSFGARGTPSAVLLDADALVASSVVSGAPAILELARAKPLSEVGASSVVLPEAKSNRLREGAPLLQA